MQEGPSELEQLRQQVAALTARVYQLEQQAGVVAPHPVQTPPASAAAPREAAQQGNVQQPPLRPPQAQPRAARVRQGATAESRSSLETRIGAEWLNRVGIVALLFGTSYFLKFAFENNWVGPAGRVLIGILAGVAMVLWSERFRARGFERFSWSLKAVGVGTMYLSVWAAAQLYSLVPAAIAFAAMVVITGVTAWLAIRQNAEVLAAMAMLGGFATPVLLSAGANRPLILFWYVAVLNAATLWLVRERPWFRLAPGALLGTLSLYVAWHIDFYTEEQFSMALFFVTLHFALLAAMPLVARLARSEVFVRLLLILPVATATAYYLQLVVIFPNRWYDAPAYAAVLLAGVYFGLSQLAASLEDRPASLAWMHLGIAVGLFTLAVPLKLDDHWVSILWFIEAAALFWLAQRQDSMFWTGLGTAVLTLAIARLLMYDFDTAQRAFFNMRFFSYLLGVALLALIARGLRHLHKVEETSYLLSTVAMNVLALLALNYEVRDLFVRSVGPVNTVARDFTYSAVWLAFGAAVMFAGFMLRSAMLRWQALSIIALTVAKVFVYDVSALKQGYRIVSFIALGAVLLFISFVYQRDWLKLSRRTTDGQT